MVAQPGHDVLIRLLSWSYAPRQGRPGPPRGAAVPYSTEHRLRRRGANGRQEGAGRARCSRAPRRVSADASPQPANAPRTAWPRPRCRRAIPRPGPYRRRRPRQAATSPGRRATRAAHPAERRRRWPDPRQGAAWERLSQPPPLPPIPPVLALTPTWIRTENIVTRNRPEHPYRAVSQPTWSVYLLDHRLPLLGNSFRKKPARQADRCSA